MNFESDVRDKAPLLPAYGACEIALREVRTNLATWWISTPPQFTFGVRKAPLCFL
jgi:hypothetical protein